MNQTIIAILAHIEYKMKKKVLDITNEVCPMTFLKTKVFITENSKIKNKIILIKGKNNLKMLKNSLEKNFLIESKKVKKDIYEMKLKSPSNH
tara:strand:- start:31 stop:306 length:276 start_codon:yes stop_codon:yes gene_type:complete